MTDFISPLLERPGHSVVPHNVTREHILIVLVEDRIGSIDRVVGLMRRRRANMHTLVLGRNGQLDMVRMTVVVNDSEVAVEHLVEQLRKIVDVHQVEYLTAQEAITRELALIRVNSSANNYNEVIETAHLFGAQIINIAPETVTVEVVGSMEKVEKFIEALNPYGIRDIARSGRVALARGTAAGE
jgi:acetolactate synthase I/III small subunit